MEIRYFRNEQIDKIRWDSVIDESPDGKVYAYSWYLDALSERWDALVAGDYEMIMPLPWNRKYGICYVYTPIFIQQLGIFSKKNIAPESVIEFFKSIPARFRFIELSAGLRDNVPVRHAVQKSRSNYILDIDKPYEEIRASYRSDAKKKLRTGHQFIYTEGADVKKIIADYRTYNGQALPGIKEANYIRMEMAMIEAEKRNHLYAAQITDDMGNTAATGLFLVDPRRIYYVIGSQTNEGREKHATHFLLDQFFKEHCRQKKIFDFEGSDNPGIAEFFKKWGSVPEYYTKITISRFPLNWLK